MTRAILKNRYAVVVILLIFGVAGSILLAISRAGTPTASVETESGTIGTCTTQVSDTTASQGQAIKLGTCAVPGSFVHPGILLDTTQLDFVKGKIAAGAQPWTAAFAKTTSSFYGKLTPTAHAVPTLDRTIINSDGNSTTADLNSDTLTAVTQALEYYYSPSSSPNKDTYAQNAIKILNAWATTLASINSTAQLDASWAAEAFPRAAEIIRYTYTPPAGEATLNVAAISAMFTNKLLPQLNQNSAGSTSSNGNWELAMADGTMNIGVFTNDRTAFNTGVAMWRARVPAYIYQSTDGTGPVAPPGGLYNTAAKVKCFWLNSGSVSSTCTIPAGFAFKDGLAQETCRDMSHVILGFESIALGAETARLQGVDLYGEQKQRIVDGYEFNAKYDLQALANLSTDGKTGTVQDGICGGKLTLGGTGYQVGWEVAYNEYANRLGVSMPYTLQMINKLRPTGAGGFIDWETLTSAGH